MKKRQWKANKIDRAISNVEQYEHDLLSDFDQMHKNIKFYSFRIIKKWEEAYWHSQKRSVFTYRFCMHIYVYNDKYLLV